MRLNFAVLMGSDGFLMVWTTDENEEWFKKYILFFILWSPKLSHIETIRSWWEKFFFFGQHAKKLQISTTHPHTSLAHQQEKRERERGREPNRAQRYVLRSSFSLFTVPRSRRGRSFISRESVLSWNFRRSLFLSPNAKLLASNGRIARFRARRA